MAESQPTASSDAHAMEGACFEKGPRGPLEIIAVDNGYYYDTRFVVRAEKPKKQAVRIFGRNFTRFIDVRLSSRDVTWTEFRHEHVRTHRAPQVGSDAFYAVVYDAPVPRVPAAGAESDEDTGEIVVTVTNDPPEGGSTTAIQTTEVDYVDP